jgi:hypothetical protein
MRVGTGAGDSDEISGYAFWLLDSREYRFDPFAALALRQSVFEEND